MIVLRKFARGDFARLIGWIPSAAFLLQWSGATFMHPLDERQLEAHLQEAEGDQPTRQIFTAVDAETGAAVGHIELSRISPRNRSAALSCILVGETAQRGKGVGREMVRRALEEGFDRLGLHRIELVVFDFNSAAIACYERAGFVKEGRLRDARRFGDEYWSLIQMGILEQEWRAGKAGPAAVPEDADLRAPRP
jgi:RimJ/RimL family protein N-acetyltransferase